MRRSTLAGVALSVALLMGASAALANAPVLLNARFASGPVEPTTFGPDKGPGPYIEASNYVEGITWSSWGGSQATGSGRVRLLVGTTTSPVTVTLGGLTDCGGQSIYTTYSLALAPAAATPRFWPDGQNGSFPCHITAGYLNPTDPGERQAAARGDCTFNGLVKLGTYATPVPWAPVPPRGRYVGLCRMSWRSWGSSSAIGTGIMRNGFSQWAAVDEVSGLAWCPSQGLAYTKAKMTLYGKGEKLTKKGSVTKGEAAHLLRSLGKPSVRKRVYTQSLTGCDTNSSLSFPIKRSP
jgi:hypothetical protein